MGEYNETIFNPSHNKLIGEKMSEQLEIMKYLAGLLNEALLILMVMLILA